MNTTLDFTSNGIKHQIHVTETDDKYKIQIADRTWTLTGPQSDSVLRHTFLVLETNWRRGTLPETNTDEYFRAMQGLAELQVDEATDKLVKNGFPPDAVAVFKEFAVEQFAVHIGLAINEYWKMKFARQTEPDHVINVSIEGIPCELRITGAQKPEYHIEIVPVVPSDATRETPSLMLKAAGLGDRNHWTVKGPFDQEYRRSLTGLLEDNWQQETLPTDKEPKGLRKVIRKLTNYYVDPIIYEIKQQTFPADALPAFRQCITDDFSSAIEQAIEEFWLEKEEG